MRPNRRSTRHRAPDAWVPPCAAARALLAISQATADALTARFPQAAGRDGRGSARRHRRAVGRDARSRRTRPKRCRRPASCSPWARSSRARTCPGWWPRTARWTSSSSSEHPLVVVGALGWETGETLDALRSLGERCTMLGYVSDAALAELYRRCAVFCYPSLGEGFGLPVLEAMAAGAAVLTSNLSSLPEVGGDAVEYADPHDTASIAAGLRRVLTDTAHRAELARRAERRAGEFSWEKFARIALQTLEASSQTPSRRS